MAWVIAKLLCTAVAVLQGQVGEGFRSVDDEQVAADLNAAAAPPAASPSRAASEVRRGMKTRSFLGPTSATAFHELHARAATSGGVDTLFRQVVTMASNGIASFRTASTVGAPQSLRALYAEYITEELKLTIGLDKKFHLPADLDSLCTDLVEKNHEQLLYWSYMYWTEVVTPAMAAQRRALHVNFLNKPIYHVSLTDEEWAGMYGLDETGNKEAGSTAKLGSFEENQFTMSGINVTTSKTFFSTANALRFIKAVADGKAGKGFQTGRFLNKDAVQISGCDEDIGKKMNGATNSAVAARLGICAAEIATDLDEEQWHPDFKPKPHNFGTKGVLVIAIVGYTASGKSSLAGDLQKFAVNWQEAANGGEKGQWLGQDDFYYFSEYQLCLNGGFCEKGESNQSITIPTKTISAQDSAVNVKHTWVSWEEPESYRMTLAQSDEQNPSFNKAFCEAKKKYDARGSYRMTLAQSDNQKTADAAQSLLCKGINPSAAKEADSKTESQFRATIAKREKLANAIFGSDFDTADIPPFMILEGLTLTQVQETTNEVDAVIVVETPEETSWGGRNLRAHQYAGLVPTIGDSVNYEVLTTYITNPAERESLVAAAKETLENIGAASEAKRRVYQEPGNKFSYKRDGASMVPECVNNVKTTVGAYNEGRAAGVRIFAWWNSFFCITTAVWAVVCGLPVAG